MSVAAWKLVGKKKKYFSRLIGKTHFRWLKWTFTLTRKKMAELIKLKAGRRGHRHSRWNGPTKGWLAHTKEVKWE